ncbi:MAG: diacylglycerol kinase family lipid kinase [Chloroflexi bacterium]|nr:diacylglycerol kinase family lipid kinase [Chloroflexota bacterium]
MRTCLIIANPAAGHGAGRRLVPDVRRILSEQDTRCEIVLTERPWHAAELAQAGAEAGHGVVVAMGGDGTANEVLNGLMAAKAMGRCCCQMGIIAVGRGNDMAYGMGIPTGVEESCHTLANGSHRTVDVGRVVGGLYPEGRYFGNGIGIGFDTIVGFEAAKLRRLTGFAAYFVAALKTMFLYYTAPLTRIEYDGNTLSQPSLMVSLMNGQRMGGGFMMAPDSSPDDGLIDVCVVHQVSRARMLPLILRFMQGTQYTQRPVKGFRAREIIVTALDGRLPAHADGETICTDGQQLQITVLPRQIGVICGTEGVDT